MSVASKIRINTHYTRSVNLVRDADSEALVNAYIPTSRALATLQRMADTFRTKEAPRAWALVGPYGSGKSSFAVFLSHVLGDPALPATKAAQKVLKQSHEPLAKSISATTRNSSGYCRALLTGSPEPLARRLVASLSAGADEYWSSKRGRTPAIVERLQKAARRKSLSVSKIVELVGELQDAVAKSGGKGVLVLIDELGKFLEYEARHYGANDIYLLQALAEHALAGHAANLMLVVLLHQALEQYAKGLGEALKNEWVKVQGRFENVPFLESTEQVLRIVSAAFQHSLTATEQVSISKQAHQIAQQLAKHKALPGVLDAKGAAAIFAQCYPLHPISALLLPMLCQRVAQNERTLFSYLGSQENHGFRHSLSQLNKVGDWIYPWEIYEYFILNQPATLNDHLTHRRWAEVVTAVERLGDAPAEQEQLIKTIGLFNIVGTQGGLKAAKDLIDYCLPSKSKVNPMLASLEKHSLIQFRKFSGEYRVWQGSDFDLDEAVQEELSQLGRFELAAALNQRQSMLPVVARKYTIKTGALRYFQPYFIDAHSFKKAQVKTDEARILFFLAQGQGDQNTFHQEITNVFSGSDIVVLSLNGEQLREAMAEVVALERVRINRQELNTDPVAQREFHDRLSAAEQALDGVVRALIAQPGDNSWYWEQACLKINNKRGLQHELSRVLESVYDKSPIVPNELINRSQPSTQAAAARNKLLMAMLNHQDEEDLGIDKYPAEKAIYRALFKASGLHRQIKGKWRLAAPITKKDPYNVGPVWKRIETFFEQTERAPKAFTQLDSVLTKAPYGVKAGVLPLLYIAAYLVHQHELALYEEGNYTPYLTDEHLERFVRRPQDFAIQSFRIKGLRAKIFKQYAEVLYGDLEGERSLLSIARPLAKFMGDLPEFTHKTKRLPKIALKVRDAFHLAKSPEALLFDALPTACGFVGLNVGKANHTELKEFSKTLKDALQELKYAYPRLIENQCQLLAQAFNIPKKIDLSDLRAIVRGRVEGLGSYTVDVQGLRAFIRRAAKTTEADEEWFNNLLLFLGHKPSKKWTDTDVDTAEFRLSEFSRRLNDLEKLRVQYEGEKRKRGANFDVVLLRAIRQGKSEHDEVVCIDKNAREGFKNVKAAIEEQLGTLGDHELQLAALADIVDEFLIQYRKRTSKDTKPAVSKAVGKDKVHV